MEDAADNTTATLAIPASLPGAGAGGGASAHWLPVHLKAAGGKKPLDRLTDAELGPFAPGAQQEEAAGAAAAAAGPADDAPSSDQQQQNPAAAVGSAPASAALQASLRGRALAGARWPLPPGVGGLVLEPAPDLDVEEDNAMEEDEEDYGDDDEDDYGGRQRQKQQQQQGRPGSEAAAEGGGGAAPRQRSWRAVAAFDELVAWNHDTAPAPSDAAWRLMDFLAVSAAAHGAAGAGGGSGLGGAPITVADVDAEVARVKA